MHKNYKTFGPALLVLLSATGVNAADINAGKAKAVACQGCHGAAGISATPLWPNLAGQTAAYIDIQLHHFKSGRRVNPMMKPLADGLSDADMQNLAAYFASLPAAKPSAGAEAKLVAQGKDKTAMCMGCHGDKLAGQGQFPRLAGQHPEYLGKQLHDFKSGMRQAGHMNAVANTLSDDDIKAITAYAGSLSH